MRCVRLVVLTLAMLGLAVMPAAAAPEGQLTWAVHVSLAPTWFDPAETPGIITPYMVMYALHDALAKPMPDQPMAPSLAEAWTVAPDGRTYDFTLRKGVTFHNGDPLTADDVKFSFERYRGAAAKTLKERVAAVEVVDTNHVRFRLKNPWPDFLLFYTSASGAGWIVPKKYVEKVGDEAFKKAPVGAGPYRFVSFTPGVELVVEAFDHYWRKSPTVKRLVFRSFQFFWQPPALTYDPTVAKKLLAEASYPSGFDAGEYFCDASYSNVGEAVVADLRRIGIGAQLRPLERAAFFSGYGSKKFKNLIQAASGAFGNAATRLEAFVVTGGTYVYGSYPDLDGLYREQASELDVKKREAILHRLQQLLHEKTVHAPIWELAFLNGAGPRVEESGLGLIAGHAYSAPYEDVRIKK